MTATRQRRSWSPRTAVRERFWRARRCARGACTNTPWARQRPASAGSCTIVGSRLVDLRRAVAERQGAQIAL
eukprot:2325876-Alexandrium_andersonii.AAC.1